MSLKSGPLLCILRRARARSSAAVAAAAARGTSRTQLLSCDRRSAVLGGKCPGYSGSANGSAPQMEILLPVTSYLIQIALPSKRSATVEHMPHPAARLREARELPRIHGLEEWGGAGFTGGEDDQCRTEMVTSKTRYDSRRSRRGGTGEGGGQQKKTAASFGGRPAGKGPNKSSTTSVVTATNAIIALNVGVFMMQEQDPSITTGFFNLAYAITDHGEWYRLVTSMALHGSWTHVLCNSLSFFSIGRPVERAMGTKKFVALYLCSGVAGNMLSCIANPLTPSLGASGAVFGVLGAEAILLLMGPRGTVGGFLASIANTAVFALIVAIFVPNIDHMGHAGGFIGGALMALLVGRRSARYVPLTACAVALLCFLAESYEVMK